MKKIILIGRVAAGKTTLTQALNGEDIHYYKTQYINYLDTIIDTPGEYTELRQTSGALALYAYEADVVGLVLSAKSFVKPYMNIDMTMLVRCSTPRVARLKIEH